MTGNGLKRFRGLLKFAGVLCGFALVEEGLGILRSSNAGRVKVWRTPYSPDGFVRINDKQITLHPESIPAAGLFCPNSGTVEHDALVVTSLCVSFELPPMARQALRVYRGDPKTDVCRDFVDRFGVNKTVVVFSDMDPKGLEIALTIPHANYWLGPVPEAW